MCLAPPLSIGDPSLGVMHAPHVGFLAHLGTAGRGLSLRVGVQCGSQALDGKLPGGPGVGVPVALVLYAAAVVTPSCAVEVLGPGAAPLTLCMTVFAHTVRVRGFRMERVDPPPRVCCAERSV